MSRYGSYGPILRRRSNASEPAPQRSSPKTRGTERPAAVYNTEYLLSDTKTRDKPAGLSLVLVLRGYNWLK
jgi:hypothetical protein